MSPNTQIALTALILFFAVAAVSIVWPRLTGLRWSSLKPAGGLWPATMRFSGGASPTGAADRQGGPPSRPPGTDRWTGAKAILHRWTGRMPIQHRIIGGALGLVTLLLLAFWLIGRDRAQRVLGSPLGLTILFIYTLALMQYLAVGIRHLIWRFGYGTEPERRRELVLATPMAAMLFTSLIWVGFQIRHGTPPTPVDRSAPMANPQDGVSDHVLAYESARRDYVAARSEVETLAAATHKMAGLLSADPFGVDPRMWPSREQLTEALRKLRTAQGGLRGAWASVPPHLRSGLEPPPSK